jgi:hypothetical protein
MAKVKVKVEEYVRVQSDILVDGEYMRVENPIKVVVDEWE